MTNIQTFKLDVKGTRVFTVNIETYGKTEWETEKFLDSIYDDISNGRNVENCIHYF